MSSINDGWNTDCAGQIGRALVGCLTAVFAAVVLVAILGGLAFLGQDGFAEKASPPAAAALPPISQLQSLSALATMRVRINDTLSGENQHYRGEWLLHGEAVLGVDLSEVRYLTVDKEQRTAVLELPQPHLVSSKVDHERTRELSVERTVLLPSPGREGLRDDVWKHADRKIATLALHEGYLEAAKLQTERVLKDLYEGLGWDVTFQWVSRQ